MRLRYYKSTIYKIIKDLYFKHFRYLNIDDDILNENIDKNIKFMIKDLDSYYFEFEKLINDYIDCEKETHIPQSTILQEYDNHLTISDDMITKTLEDLKNVSEATRLVIRILIDLSTTSYLVGGSIRDIITGKIPKDFDFVTDASYDKMIIKFKEYGFTVIETGKQFLVLNVKYDNEEFEIANFRKDGTYMDGRRPESVSIGTIEDDAQRRDFTINALYFNLFLNELIDPTGQGLNDLIYNRLKFVGNAKDRLEEDFLRVYRAYRFISKGFIPSKNTLKNIRNAFECAQKTVAPERVKNEIEKIAGVSMIGSIASSGKRILDFTKLLNIISFVHEDIKQEIKDEVVNMLDQLQMFEIFEIPVRYLNSGDLLIDLKDKTLHEVNYTEHYDSSGMDKYSNTVMVDYVGQDDADNFDINYKVMILINKNAMIKRKLESDDFTKMLEVD